MRIHTPASESRQRLSATPGIGGHVAEHAVLEHGEAVEPVELLGARDAPLGEVPRAGVAEGVGVDATVLGHHGPEAAGVVAAHAVEVDAEDEAARSRRGAEEVEGGVDAAEVLRRGEVVDVAERDELGLREGLGERLARDRRSPCRR